MKCKRCNPAKAFLPSCKAPLLAGLAMVLLLFLLPLTLLLPRAQSPDAEGSTSAQDTESTVAVPNGNATDPADGGEEVSDPSKVTVLLDGRVQTLSLESYLWGVVAAEMPAAFDQQALDAQAVAARTYALYRLSHPSANHPKAQICGDSTCCQAWISEKERRKQWAKASADAYAAKITQAIDDTRGLALYYEDVPILAAFHASSAGSTKSALEVWGEDFPYLQEVASPEDDTLVPNYYSTVSLSKEQFATTFSAQYPDADLTATDCKQWFGEATLDSAGLPTAIAIGGVTVDTGQLRTLFALRSASFTVECEGDTITFYVTGYGHGVGMSQYGANALAKQGKSFRDILSWYYPHTTLQTLSS